MSDFSPSPYQLLFEAIIFWSIAIVLYIGRMQLIYTSMLVLIQVSARYATNLVDPAQYEEILSNPQEVNDRIFGSKIVIGLEQCMLFSTWGVKICMLTMFWRLTHNVRLLRMYVNLIAVFIAVGFVVIMVTYYAVYCRPFSQYWAMPVQDLQCATYQNYSITQAVFNISSDAAMLVLPVPLLQKTQMNRRKKIMLAGVMSLGVFTIAAAILNKVFNFASPLTTTYQLWYIREASTAIYVANLVCLSPLLRRMLGSTMQQIRSWPYGHHARWHWKGSSSASHSGQIQLDRKTWTSPHLCITLKRKCEQSTDAETPSREYRSNCQRRSEEAII
ncbi:uncharacterized protein BP01DRAFT_335708 [Aspergillus saccharolyticus JOP 1030-1]|uniref:Rhodopsin domain-containing protein n=1 Tax=Aspergillus saccharolyticus JOP 1030-1 TaxID=1450539 RepID=A0A318ZLJ2_9EURO|nr:hypothetical protein BP01DRAFT_335708 [Aspergillus saccharolyticus JOP 1030-1]PYH47304.1 hypothetical protein BP01DRAFT_335708 [Aspergillus saccharolyticus JOP 1030-1]